MLKATLALHEKVLPPSINFERPNSNVDWTASPFAVNTELRDWDIAADRTARRRRERVRLRRHELPPRDGGVSSPTATATNGHASSASIPVGPIPADEPAEPAAPVAASPRVEPSSRSRRQSRRCAGRSCSGAPDEAELANALRTELAEARQGRHLDPTPPSSEALRAPERIAIDYADGARPRDEGGAGIAGAADGQPVGVAGAARARHLPRQRRPGQGRVPVHGPGVAVREHARRAAPSASRSSRSCSTRPTRSWLRCSRAGAYRTSSSPTRTIRPRSRGPRRSCAAPRSQQPAVITVDIALTRLLGEYGIAPDMVMGHSVGEYGALVSAGSAVVRGCARGRQRARDARWRAFGWTIPGRWPPRWPRSRRSRRSSRGSTATSCSPTSTRRIRSSLGGATEAVAQAVAAVQQRGHTAIPLPVSHGFHTEIVAPASAPLRSMLQRLGLRPPAAADRRQRQRRALSDRGRRSWSRCSTCSPVQVASPVQFVKGLRTLYDEGARIFVEVGPKHALQGFASDVLGDDAVMSLATNHPKQGGVASFNSALCGLSAAGPARTGFSHARGCAASDGRDRTAATAGGTGGARPSGVRRAPASGNRRARARAHRR